MIEKKRHNIRELKHPGKWLAFLALLGVMALSGCGETIVRNDLEMIKDRGELVVITRNNTACYYEGPYGQTGFEFELAKAFADHIGVRLKIRLIEEEAEMIGELLDGKADILAPGFPFGQRSAHLLALGPGYLEVQQLVVGRRGGSEFNSLEDITQKTAIWTTAGSARLEILKKAVHQNREIKWLTLNDYSSEELLQSVWNRSVPLTVVESNILSMNRRYFPELVVHFSLGDPQQLTWAIDPKNRHLRRAIVSWFAREGTQERLNGLQAHYYDHLERFDYVDLARYRRRIKKRLPKYRTHFEDAAAKYGLDWQLVAAQSYQESHWNPKAKSHTGVRGLMMLTQDTAKTLGLKNRMAPKESIYAGTRYLARLRRMVGDSVPEPDRTLMALAAYNIGIGHLRDARSLADKLKKPSGSWHGVRAVLPLLQSKKYYRDLDHGYARGREAVQYVDRIRTYHRVLNNAMAPAAFTGYGG